MMRQVTGAYEIPTWAIAQVIRRAAEQRESGSGLVSSLKRVNLPAGKASVWVGMDGGGQ
jgi:hypothetical protein